MGGFDSGTLTAFLYSLRKNKKIDEIIDMDWDYEDEEEVSSDEDADELH